MGVEVTLQPTEKYLRTKIDTLTTKIDKVVKRHYIEAEDNGDGTIDVCNICREEYPCQTVELLTS